MTDDNLKPAKGLLIGLMIGAAIWGMIIYTILRYYWG